MNYTTMEDVPIASIFDKNPRTCRLCGQDAKDVTAIFDGAIENLPDTINKYLPITIKADDVLPLMACILCTNTLLAFDELVITCIEAQKCFKDLLMHHQNEDHLHSTVNIKQEKMLIEEVEQSTDEDEELIENVGVLKAVYPKKECIEICETEILFTDEAENVCDALKVALKSTAPQIQDNCEVSNKQEFELLAERCKIKSASGALQYKCDICSKICRRASILRSHYNTHIKSNGGVANTGILCYICGKTFQHHKSMKRHIKTVHQAAKKFPCTSCGIQFVTEEDFTIHVQSCSKYIETEDESINHSKEDSPTEIHIKNEMLHVDHMVEDLTDEVEKRENTLTLIYPKPATIHNDRCMENSQDDVESETLQIQYNSLQNNQQKLDSKQLADHCMFKLGNGQQRYKCDVCLTIFKQVTQLLEHYNKHSDAKYLVSNEEEESSCDMFISRNEDDSCKEIGKKTMRVYKNKCSADDSIPNKVDVKKISSKVDQVQKHINEVLEVIQNSEEEIPDAPESPQIKQDAHQKEEDSQLLANRCMFISATGEQGYKCDICTVVFMQIEELILHYKQHSKSDCVLGSFEAGSTCGVCGKTYKRRYQMLRHLKEKHGNVERTPHYDHLHNNQVKLDSILLADRCMFRSCDGQRRYKCDVCSKICMRVSDLTDHYKEHTTLNTAKCCDDAASTCKICGQMCTNSHHLSQHIEVKHGSTQKFSCIHCKKSYDCYADLHKHMQQDCDSSSAVKKALQNEAMIIEQKQDSDVMEVSKEHNALDKESETLQKEEEIGNNGVTMQDALRSSSKSPQIQPNNNENSDLNTDFQLLIDLCTRESSATSGKQHHECDICNSLFTQSSALMEHYNEQHQLNICNSQEETPCPVCGQLFPDSQGLEAHALVEHKAVQMFLAQAEHSFHVKNQLRPMKYTCKECKRCFQTQRACSMHTRFAHPRPLSKIECTLCKTVFKSMRQLKHHQGRCASEKSIK